MATYTSNYAWTKPSGGDPVDIEVLNDNLDDQDSIVHQAFLDLAPVFSTASTYAVKDVVLYDNKVWICHTAVTTAGAWTGSTNWTQTTVGETGGVATYADLPDKPSVNGNELSGNKTGTQLGLQNTLTFDNVPTDGSDNPVKSGGVYQADEAIRKWTTAEAKSVSGNPITSLDGSARKAEGFVVTLEPIQSGSGTPSPTNVRPITGYTECVVDDHGKNFVKLIAGSSKESRGIVCTAQNDGSIKVNGTATGGVYSWNFATLTYDEMPHGRYKLCGKFAEGHGFFVYLYRNNAIIKSDIATTYTNDAVIFDTSSYNYDTVIIGIFIPNGQAYVDKLVYPMIIDADASNTDFEPYQGDTVTITFGQTVYGGSVDFKTGKVTVTHGIVLCDNLSFSLNDQYKVAFAQIVGKKVGYSNVISSAYKTHGVHYYSLQNGEIAGVISNDYINIKNDTFVDVSDVETKLSGVQVCYELETPIELTLTPAEVELLKGYNYISTNGTTIALDYLPNSLLAEAENYVDDADSVLNAKIDEIDGRVDSIEAMSYHTVSDGTKTVTLTNVYQQIFISISIATTRTIYLVVQQKANTPAVETIFSTAGKTPIDIAVTRVSDNSFTITIPQFAQTNIISTEPFSVG
jgi:hypothetical protein